MLNGLPLDRRRLLKLGVAGTATLAVGGGALSWFARGYDALLAPGDRPLALSRKEFAVVKAFVRAALPAADGFPSGESLGVPQRIDEELWAAEPDLRRDLSRGLHLFEHAPPLYGHLGRFTRLAPDAQRACLEAMLTGGSDTVRQVAGALKQLAHLFYYAHPATWAAIGYDGPYVAKAVPPESARRYRALLEKA